MSDLPDWKNLTAREKAEAIRPHLAAGLSNNSIASLFLNCGRCQIAGAVNRMKVTGLNPPVRRAGASARPKGTKQRPRTTKMVQQTSSWRGANNPPASDFKARAEQRAASPGLPAHLVAGEAHRPIETSIPVSRNLKLIELTERTCKWPHGDPLTEVFGFCGNDTAETGPYCKYHGRLAHTPATVRQRAGHRSAERIS
ncbi:GcrA cell cycle regulator [Mesorhizobium sp. M4A.F.Ca.ET.020.02.1.1]|uniref:GcrA family cell cycle regulator n=1 Tax=Mesorhizobium sp. M4A.F.Ca.ET.020.02.1.1 TaxID=2496652 RepID=UPI000FD21309|nr:GcrA family cell cycle regulator [Mesorhizobium sp. M4A.F.Ca.ET.020.02.1.1]RVD44898.1 GcrA cell cycle regulator [Mesorhizobium sp. M4A.F.Ca.ET.020.02.1.1]